MNRFQLLAAIKLRLIFLIVLSMFISCATDSLEGDFTTKKDPIIEAPDTGQQVPEKPDSEPDQDPEADPAPTPNPKPVTPTPKPTTPAPVPSPVVSTPPENDNEAQQILALVNQFRKESGVDPVVLNSALNTAAFKHSKDMNDNGYFSHTGQNGSTFGERTKKENYSGFAFGENIAISDTARQTFNLWKESPGHRRNMLNPNVNEMGIGKSGRYWTQIFGKN